MSLGISTDTQDKSGKVIAVAGAESITEKILKDALLAFKGKQKQLPPMISAKHHKGKRLYQLARKGIEIKREPQDIEIRDIELIKLSRKEAEFRVVCSKGTYIRTLCHDIGQRLGCGAHMKALRRIRSGSFHIDDAVSLNEINRS
jgi:tRNA pseudouridine55 synthase